MCPGFESLIRHQGGIAQLVERLHGMQEVSGSIPLTSTKIQKSPYFGKDFLFYPLFLMMAEMPYLQTASAPENNHFIHHDTALLHLLAACGFAAVFRFALSDCITERHKQKSRQQQTSCRRPIPLCSEFVPLPAAFRGNRPKAVSNPITANFVTIPFFL